MSSKHHRRQSLIDLSFLRLLDGRRFIPSVQSLVFDYLDQDTLTAVGVTSQTAQLFLQSYLCQLPVLTVRAYSNRHDFLSLARRHCRKLTHLICMGTMGPSMVSLVTDLVLHNSHSLQELSGRPIKHSSILNALLECSSLQSLFVETDRDTFDLVKDIVARNQQLKSLRFGERQNMSIEEILQRASPNLLEVSTPLIGSTVAELGLVVTRFPKLQTLHVALARVPKYLPALLRHLASLTDLSITSTSQNAERNRADVQLFLKARGYSHPDWDCDDYGSALDDRSEDEEMAEAKEYKMRVLELPRLRKLKLDESWTGVMSIQSEVLEEATLTVFYPGQAFEVLRHSRNLRKVGLFIEGDDPDIYAPADSEADVFVECCRDWPLLTQFKTEMGLGRTMLPALVSHCRHLESLSCRLFICSEVSVLALFALPCLASLKLQTFSFFLESQSSPSEADTHKQPRNKTQDTSPSLNLDNEDDGKGEDSQVDDTKEASDVFKLPAVVQSNLRHLSIAGNWDNTLVDRVQCPHLQTLSLHASVASPELRLDPLVASAAQSLTSLSLHRNTGGWGNPVALADPSLPLCTKLKSLSIPEELDLRQ